MANLSPREELLQIQKQIFRKNQRIIEESILVSEQGFHRYETNYLRHVKDFEKPIELSELRSALKVADWIYMGDYHTNRQSQRALLRVLKMLITETDRFVIALEFIQKRHQPLVDKFLKSKISLNTFLKQINLRKHFYFDLWENYEPIFDFSKYYQLEVFGIESAPYGAGLTRRDEAMAVTLAEIAQAHPGYKILTFVGDLHIAPENLPIQVRKKIGNGSPMKELFLYQNSEKIYWKLAQANLEEKVEVVQIDGQSFCLINTPPIVWQQSYLNWLENEEGEIDYQDPKHSFLELAQSISRFLGIKLPKSKDEVEVFTCGDLSFLERLKEDSDFSPKERRDIRRQVELSESYYIPKRKWVYLGNVSLNHAAEEATHFIRHLVAGDEFPRGSQDAFYANVMHEALGFFGSKIINQKRKCMREKDFRGMIEYFRKVRVPRDRTFELEIAHAVLEVKKLEKRARPIADPDAMLKRHDLFFGVSHALGYMLGEILYHAMVMGKLKKKELGKIFKNPFKGEGEPFEVYMGLLTRFGVISLPQRL